MTFHATYFILSFPRRRNPLSFVVSGPRARHHKFRAEIKNKVVFRRDQRSAESGSFPRFFIVHGRCPQAS
ncbi:MAG: hypothetical protein DRP46_12180 [Candidatus Zixiibacteriota bacterium]|nr:MAG: hypothetical protein DRP46_12180 [candidate division Zixibacteria bacterium]